MSEINEIQSRVESALENLRRNNPTLKQQLIVASAMFNSLQREYQDKIQSAEVLLEGLRRELNEVLTLNNQNNE